MSQGEKESIKSGKGMPKLRIRNLDKDLKDNDVESFSEDYPIDGFTLVPVYVFLGNFIDDDLLPGGCSYAA